SEDLTTELARNDALFVISRNSAFSYKGQAVKVEDVARELGVRYVLEGSVRRAGDRVRITAQLIDASTGFHLWSERYDRRLTDIFALQTELADEIQTALRVEIRDAEIARVRQPETRNVDAYDAYLRGLAHFEHFRLERNREARRWFARAIELDPEFASAHAMVGNTYGIEYMFGWNTDPALMARAEEGARRALELDIASSDAWTVLATVHLTRGEHEAAITAAERGIAAEPSLEVPYLIRGMALADQGRILPALASIAQARRLNPEGGTTDLEVFAFVESLAGRIDEAVAMLEQARAANPDLIYSRLFLLVQRDAEGRGDEARALAAEVLSINSDLTAEQGAMLLRESGAVEPLRRAGLP
ncbi:MAG: adenylate/guanylate cyclase domain-containing protein, partial [Proteobacteria bacterium]|nr:adenylate/guanylate cyclase domain-containing protein [Pseudomonadota bacterium]